MFNFGNAKKVQNEKGRKNPAFFCVHNKVFAVHLLKLSHAKLKFSPAFFKRRREPSAATVALRRARNLIPAFSFL
mgnify:CR=1 FL=1